MPTSIYEPSCTIPGVFLLVLSVLSRIDSCCMLQAAATDKGFDYLNNLQNNNMATNSYDLLGMSNLLSSGPTDFISNIAAPVPSSPIVYPPKAHIKRQKMIYHCKFGEFGILGGQFTEPSGVAVTPDNEIVVADTNNHRIQVFDREGNFKFQFGEVNNLRLIVLQSLNPGG